MQIRNIAIIAHVDHGKTTMIDWMLKQTNAFRSNQAEMDQTTILDSNDLEREKGITILAKNTAVFYNDYKINIIDTPGHADFGGEVERVISMADGALLLVDAAEGPLPQTKFVLEQAIKQKLKLILVINKIDRKDAEPERVLKQVEELFLNMVDSDDQLDFPVIYAVGRQGMSWAYLPVDFNQPADLKPIFEEIIRTIPAPKVEIDKPFKMLVSNIDFDSYKGTYAIGKVQQGILKKGQNLAIMEENNQVGSGKAQLVFTSNGLGREETLETQPGDIISITGFENIKIGQTLVDPTDLKGFPMIKLTEPTLRINIAPNTSPFAGKESEFCTARQLEERLMREKKTNIGLKIKQAETGGFIVAGRGELHLAVLIENMRREGYEMEVGNPQVIYKEIDNKKCEPFEELTIEIEKDFIGIITEEMGKRQGELLDTFTNHKGVSKMVYKVSSQNLLGFRSEILTKTRGNGLFATQFCGYFPIKTKQEKLRNGAIIASETGTATSYALEMIQERGRTLVKPQAEVYEGMVIGINQRHEDMEMNICKAKKLTNFRSNADFLTVLNQPVELSLEQALDFIQTDELLEVTPKSLRIRKRFLTKNERTKARN
jgi:GTP-binding protein